MSQRKDNLKLPYGTSFQTKAAPRQIPSAAEIDSQRRVQRRRELEAKVKANWSGGPELTAEELSEYGALTGVYGPASAKSPASPPAGGAHGMPDMGGVSLSGHAMGGGGYFHAVPASEGHLRKQRAELEWLMLEMQKKEIQRRMNDPYGGGDPAEEIRRLIKSQVSTT